jgi:deoxyribonucleoside regulator
MESALRARLDRTPVDAQSLDLLIDLATRHYLQGSSQIEIARDLGLDPSTISRYLKRARDEGIVKIDIVVPVRPNVELGLRLASEFGLDRAVVTELPPEDEDDVMEIVARAAGEFISDQLRRGSRVGIGWGQTIAAVARHLDPGVVGELQVAQLAGGLADAAPGTQGHELARQLTEIYPDSRVTYLHAPSIVDSAAICDALLADRSVQAALATAARSEIAIVGIGDMTPNATLLAASHILGDDLGELLAQGAVGSMNSRFFNADGQPVDHLDRRTVAIEWSALAAIPQVIAIAAGKAKATAVKAAIRSGTIDVLITDEGTAKAILA